MFEREPVIVDRALTNKADARASAAKDAAGRDEIAVRHFTAEEFADFVALHFYGPRKRSPEWAPHTLTDWQVREAQKLMILDAAGQLASVLWVISWPRRHGKTQFFAMYLVARAALYPNQTMVVEANSEEQADETVFRWCADLVERSLDAFAHQGQRRYTLEFKGAWAVDGRRTVDVQIVDGEIRFSNGSTITLVTTGQASSFGRKLSVYGKTELHASPQEATFHAGAGSTGDSWCGVTVVDSTQGEEGSLLHKMTEDGKLAHATGGKEGDPACAVSHIYYHDIDHACDPRSNLAPWINDDWLRSMARRMPWTDFLRNHLNQATGGGESIFPAEQLRRACETPWSGLLGGETLQGWAGEFTSRTNFRALRRLFFGHGLRIGFGLDRSMGKARSDRTMVVIEALGIDESRLGKVVREYDEDGFDIGEREVDAGVHLVLAVVFIPRSSAGTIKRLIRKVERWYGEPVLRFESYQAKDLNDWAEARGFDTDAKAMTDAAKALHVQRMCELLGEERYALPAHAKDGAGYSGLLYAELSRYEELESKGRLPSYGGRRGVVALDLDGKGPRHARVKDDAAEAGFWAVDAVHEFSMDLDDDGGVSV